MESKIALACPHCGQVLEELDGAVTCSQCNQKWSITNNIPIFTAGSPYWGEIDQPTMQKVNRLSREIGWRQAMGQVAPQLIDYIDSPRRIEWTKLLPLKPGWKALDIGAGLGGIAFPLSKQVAHVVALESVSERAEFIELRRQQENIDNIQVVAASIHEMPLPEDKFNLVVMNGILEWVALTKEGDPQAVQRGVLQRIHQLLDSGGWIYIGIENRFGFDSVLGAVDHSGHRFTGVLPRPVANFYMQRVNSRHFRTYNNMNSYRTYTYSYWGYKKLLEQAGFSGVEVWGTNSYNSPNVLYDLEHTKELKQSMQGFSPTTVHDRLFRSLGYFGAIPPMIKLFTPSFCITAQKI